jgi:hypothetical protein
MNKANFLFMLRKLNLSRLGYGITSYENFEVRLIQKGFVYENSILFEEKTNTNKDKRDNRENYFKKSTMLFCFLGVGYFHLIKLAQCESDRRESELSEKIYFI